MSDDVDIGTVLYITQSSQIQQFTSRNILINIAYVLFKGKTKKYPAWILLRKTEQI